MIIIEDFTHDFIFSSFWIAWWIKHTCSDDLISCLVCVGFHDALFLPEASEIINDKFIQCQCQEKINNNNSKIIIKKKIKTCVDRSSWYQY